MIDVTRHQAEFDAVLVMIPRLSDGYIYIKPFDTRWSDKVGSRRTGRWRLVPREEGAGQMKWKVGTMEYETVQQYLAVVQRNQFFAVAAGVVVHQHTRVLMAELHERGDGTSAEKVRAGLQQLAAELTAAYKSAAVSTAEIEQVVVESTSGPQGKAAVEGRVAAANAKIAEKLCGCERCKDAAARVQGQSRLSKVRTVAAVEP